MVFDSLPNSEKVYWLNYLIRMEEMYASMALQLDIVNLKTGIQARRQDLLKEANLFYKDFYTEIKEELYPLVSKDAILDIDALKLDYNGIGAFSFNYLIRDWSNKETDSQQQVISDAIEQKIDLLELNVPEGKALFLGCGTGRYAVNLAHKYQQVEAFDASVLMIWCLEHLQKIKTWDVLRKVERNCRTIEDTVQRIRLEMTPYQGALIESKVHFFPADAANIPLENHSINHIYSIYFTDVLPLYQLYENSIDCLLVGGGLFIHFGPLEYFFNAEKEMLSAEEVRLFFEQKGYVILTDEFLETKHLANPNSMRHRVYDNWFFIAQKPKNKKIERLSSITVLSLNQEIKIQSTAILEKGSCVGQKYMVCLNEQSYQLPAVVHEFLLSCNGVNDINTILKNLELEDITLEESSQLMTIIKELLEANIIVNK
jgi:SAM-dependent methyltransferase